jgi:3-oxo-5-alpha-steroid 4-dehydrogenase 1
MSPEIYNTTLIVMAIIAVIVYIALQYFKAGYGYLRTSKWGPAIPNRPAWILMECPVFLVMIAIMVRNWNNTNAVTISMATLFLIHYFQRSFIFPLLIKGKSKMPIAIILMGATFNVINGILIGFWLFQYSSYDTSWFTTPQFIIGSIIFIFGMVVNLHSDYIIRHLRKPGDTRHYIPKGGMFKYVSSANYFGEITEWFGFAILTWSLPGALFCLWTFANLAPRANSLYEKYTEEFGVEFTSLKRKRVIPFIY